VMLRPGTALCWHPAHSNPAGSNPIEGAAASPPRGCCNGYQPGNEKLPSRR